MRRARSGERLDNVINKKILDLEGNAVHYGFLKRSVIVASRGDHFTVITWRVHESLNQNHVLIVS